MLLSLALPHRRHAARQLVHAVVWHVAAPLQARTTPAPIAHGAGLPGRPRGEPSESGDGSSSSGWETVEEEEDDPA